MGIFLGLKVFRHDFWYWIPIGGALEVVVCILQRVVVKTISDFTSIVQFRHPYELGGLYWTFELVLTMCSLPVVIRIYEGQEGNKRVIDLAWRLFYILTPSVFVMIGVFFMYVEKYLNTFYSVERGKDLTLRGFKESEKDEVKALFTFQTSRHHWKSIEEEVRAWMELNWSSWMEEKPKWLTENTRNKIPKEWIPLNEEQRDAQDEFEFSN
eukprot:CAMPEP_0118634898 /NCGR_PEP_ID=MMETSP0785-20121206/1791_1 /TAXON_ID=91992 /ORGANISM="Bolidomonas pacifica, Strain CCMP 1866" /LENGTH=210 /DNA_ID=CAMNT_0006525901 /DNA_START=645 /DNA_END=1274 /DNA_ORIENTATION=+